MDTNARAHRSAAEAGSSKQVKRLPGFRGPGRAPRDDNAMGRRSPHAVPSIGALAFGLALSVAVWWAVLQHENRLAELEFGARAGSHALILQSGINKYLHDVSALRAM